MEFTYYVSIFKRWLQSQGVIEPPELIEPKELDTYISRFLLTLTKFNGDDYEPLTFLIFPRAISSYLMNCNYQYDILRHELFQSSRDASAAKRKELESRSLQPRPGRADCCLKSRPGRADCTLQPRPGRADSAAAESEEILWTEGQLGGGTPETLIRTLWYLNTKLLGISGSHQHYQLNWGDIRIKAEENGDEFLEFNDRLTEDRSGATGDTKPFKSRLFRNKKFPDRCPVQLHRQFERRRPDDMKMEGSPFYLAINQHAVNLKLDEWYTRHAMGEHEVASIMKCVAVPARSPGEEPTTA